jgi:predicted dinucleotide-utilizing enzyme
MTPWLATGMLRAGMDMIVMGTDAFSDDEELDS